MYLPLQRVSRSGTPFYCQTYIHACAPPSDPTIIWGTEVDLAPLRDYLKVRSLHSETLLSPAHVLLQAVAKAVQRLPELNRRVIGRSVYACRDINILTTISRSRDKEVAIVLLMRADTMTLEQIATRVWSKAVEHHRSTGGMHRDLGRLARLPNLIFGPMMRSYLWLQRKVPIPCITRVDRLFSASILVNCLDFPGAAPMTSYKPAVFPMANGVLNVTMGPPRKQPVVRENQIVIAEVAPLFVRADHRTIDAHTLGHFITSITEFLTQPELMEPCVSTDRLVDTETPIQKAA
jgi:chloramphenicol O-acetyltransferase